MLTTENKKSQKNLLSIIISYLNVKDISQKRTVNKNFKYVSENFNKYWKDELLNHFSVNNECHR